MICGRFSRDWLGRELSGMQRLFEGGGGSNRQGLGLALPRQQTTMLLAEGISSSNNFFPTSLQRGGRERIDFAKNRKFGRAVNNIGE